ncbi:glycoside hydrolase family 2 protein [Actinomadura algeriensis]|uniref:beta-mannosidase n=1 Tax=Actinomadura algeriensis TaxID=1679523 RepID=A0ABR9K0L8_9ACTN|nr:hypothetical protein [Actinomadura algeriensis]MBE1536372.1 beta-mannosidase [Actinomadura algeriensis]
MLTDTDVTGHAPAAWPVTGFVLTDTAPGAGRPAAGAAWIPAVVPGGVHESLIAAGRLPHPYRDRHESDAAWIEDRTWWYRTELRRPDVPAGHRLTLELAGLDTVATVLLDGVEIARHASQFRPLTVDVHELLHGTAELLVRIDPPFTGLTEPDGPRATRDRLRAFFAGQGAPTGGDAPSGVLSADLSMTLRRKALFSWGWDFAPRLPSLGLIRPVSLRALPGVRAAGTHWRTTALPDGPGGAARAALTVEVEGSGGREGLTVHWTLRDPDGRPVVTGAAPAAPRVEAAVTVPDARLWWTHDLGEPDRYELDVQVRDGAGVLDRRTERVGLRTVTIDRSPDPEGGRHFRFVLNGVPVFARGANWVPASMLVGSVGADHVRRLVTLARDAEMTMLRVWGGGLYESDAFYDACDELGLLVWQDFMFACVDYPDADPRLRAEVAAEAEHQVRRLRSRPCLALWCGNNEASALHAAIWGGDEPSGWGAHFYDVLLPGTVERHSPGTPYWRGSPHGELDAHANGVLDGDRHAWEVWHGADLGAGGPQDFDDPGERVHFLRYRFDRGRFISEFGLHAAPEPSTLRRWTGEPLELGSPALLHRIKDTPKNKGAALLATETGVPHSAPAYIAASMAVQAEGLAYGVAHYRRRQPVCSGALVWQLNEPWPGLSWSVIDHDGVPKAAWYALRRVFAPVIASLRRDDGTGEIEVWVTNGTPVPWSGRLTARLARFDGSAAEAVRQITATIDGGASRPVATLPAAADPRAVFAEVVDVAGRIPRHRLFLDRLRHLPLDGTVGVTVRPGAPGCARVEVTARGHAYAVRVEPTGPGFRASDGYRDLPHGAHATIEVTGLPPGFDLAALRVRTWRDDWREE